MYFSLWFLCTLLSCCFLSKHVQSFHRCSSKYHSKCNSLKQRRHRQIQNHFSQRVFEVNQLSSLHAFSQRVFEVNDPKDPNVKPKPLKIIPSVQRFFQDRIFRFKRFLATFLLFIVQRLVGIKGRMDII